MFDRATSIGWILCCLGPEFVLQVHMVRGVHTGKCGSALMHRRGLDSAPLKVLLTAGATIVTSYQTLCMPLIDSVAHIGCNPPTVHVSLTAFSVRR